MGAARSLRTADRVWDVAQRARCAGAPAHLALWATEQTLSAVLSDRARPTCRLLLVDGEPIGDLP